MSKLMYLTVSNFTKKTARQFAMHTTTRRELSAISTGRSYFLCLQYRNDKLIISKSPARVKVSEIPNGRERYDQGVAKGEGW